MKIEAYKSNNGRIFATELEAEIENKKEDLIEALGLNNRDHFRGNYGYYSNTIVELIVEHKDQVIKILKD